VNTPTPKLGLWGTSDDKRIAVSRGFDRPEPVLGYVVELYDLCWAVEGDTEKRIFNTPREAADYGYSSVWK
jgi:hypothetical protein